MGAARQPAQHIFRPDDGEGEAAQGAVEGGEHQHPARRHQLAGGAHEQADVRHVLHHFQRQHGIEAGAGGGERLGGDRAVVDLEAALLGMAAGDDDVAGGRIDAGHLPAHPRQRLGQQPAAAADIQYREPGERAQRLGIAMEMPHHRIADHAQPGRVHGMERGHLALLVPPLGAQRIEAGDLSRVDGGVGNGVRSGHG